MAATPDAPLARLRERRFPARRAPVATRGDRVSLLRASARTFEAAGALLRSQAALASREADLWLVEAARGVLFVVAGALLLAAAWVLGMVAAVMAVERVSLPLRLGAVAGLHAVLGAAFLLARRGRTGRAHG